MAIIKLQGKDINYNVKGRGYPVIFLHNGFYSTATWDTVRDDFAGNFKVIDYDRFGYGNSDKYETGLEGDIVEEGVKELSCFIEELGLDTVMLCGHCLGGAIALSYAYHNPHKVTKIVAESVGYFSDYKLLVKSDWTFQKYDEIHPALRNYLIEMHGNEYSKKIWGILCDYKDGYIMNEDYSMLDKLKKITCPVLVINGDRDFYFDVKHALAGYKKLKNARLWIVPDTGHDVHVESKKYFIDVVTDFLLKESSSE